MNLKGRDAFLYQLLSEAKFKLKLCAVDVRVDGWGWHDYGYCKLEDLEDVDVEFSELDLTKGGSWANTPSRPMGNVHWLIHDIKYYANSMKKVDSHIKGTGNEGCDWHTTYMTSALVVQLCKEKQGTKRKFSLDHAQRPYPYYGP